MSVFARCFYSALAISMRLPTQKYKKQKKWIEKSPKNPDVSLNIGIVIKNGSCPIILAGLLGSNRFFQFFK